MQTLLLLPLLLISTSLWAQHPEHHVKDDPNEVEPFERGFPKDYKSPPKPVVVDGIQKYAIDKEGKGPQNFDTMTVNDNPIYGFFFIDRLEERFKPKAESLLWDAVGRIGNQYHRIFVESEGVYNTRKGDTKNSRNEILYGYSYAPFWDLQAGYRRDFISKKRDRDFGVLSVMGLAPFEFEVDAAAYVSTEGDVSTIVEVEYSFLLTQRTQLIPRFEVEAALQQAKTYNVGRGLNDFELGVRLSHQIYREFAPYIGVSWERKTFGTKDLTEKAGEDPDVGLFLIGARIII